LDGEGAARKNYIDAIIEATTGNFEPLIDFARSEEPLALAPP
jgi:hypothetical protein